MLKKREQIHKYINISFELAQKTGFGAYIKTLLNADKEFTPIELKLNQNIKFKFFIQQIWLNTYIYIKTLTEKPDIFFSPCFIMPYFKVKGTKYITVIHDLCMFRADEMDNYSRMIYAFATNLAIKRADIIVTVSETIRNELINKYRLNPDNIKVVYNAIGEHFINIDNNKKVLDEYNLLQNKYILSVATLNKRKNIPELIKAFESISDKYPEIKLVLVGGMGNEDRERLTKHPSIIFTGYLADECLPILYKNALMYVFPSIYEGFGIPLIEAQYSNCPVVCSDIPVFREIAGNSVEFCEPNAEKFAEKLEYLINNPERRIELVERGCENVKRFEIKKIAEQLKAAME